MSRYDAREVVEIAVDLVVVKAEKAAAEVNGLRKFPTPNFPTNSCAALADPPYDRLKA